VPSSANDTISLFGCARNKFHLEAPYLQSKCFVCVAPWASYVFCSFPGFHFVLPWANVHTVQLSFPGTISVNRFVEKAKKTLCRPSGAHHLSLVFSQRLRAGLTCDSFLDRPLNRLESSELTRDENFWSSPRVTGYSIRSTGGRADL
jgi:hypothetical protein